MIPSPSLSKGSLLLVAVFGLGPSPSYSQELEFPGAQQVIRGERGLLDHAYEGLFEFSMTVENQLFKGYRMTVLQTTISPSSGAATSMTISIVSAYVNSLPKGESSSRHPLMAFPAIEVKDAGEGVRLHGYSDINSSAPIVMDIFVEKQSGKIRGQIINLMATKPFSIEGKRLKGPSDFYNAVPNLRRRIDNPALIAGTYKGTAGSRKGQLNIVYLEESEEFLASYMVEREPAPYFAPSYSDQILLPWERMDALISFDIGEPDQEFGILTLTGGNRWGNIVKWVLPCILEESDCKCQNGLGLPALTASPTNFHFTKTGRMEIPQAELRGMVKHYKELCKRQ